MTPSTYSDSFLADMEPALGDDYRSWLAFCRESALGAVDRIGTKGFIERALGLELPEAAYRSLRASWFEPYRSYHERGGKLLRPYLVCFCLKAYGKDPRDFANVVAVAEIIHSASLVLDDIIDDSVLRRGGPTMHRRVGVRVAGTAASAWLNIAFELLEEAPATLPEQATRALVEAIAWEHWVTGLGTTVDVSWPWLRSYDRSPGEYLQSVLHRSTSLTYRLPLKLGAIAAGASGSEVEMFAALGEELGLSFQIIDDILNVTPDDPHWGKQVAEDLTQGKVTLQVLLALDRSDRADRDRLIEVLEARTADPAQLQEAVDILAQSGAFDAARRMAAVHVERTKQIVERMTFLPDIDRNHLRGFVEYVVKRSR